jgi:hypothetical protein
VKSEKSGHRVPVHPYPKDEESQIKALSFVYSRGLALDRVK